jgi:hypothetical protein
MANLCEEEIRALIKADDGSITSSSAGLAPHLVSIYRVPLPEGSFGDEQ